MRTDAQRATNHSDGAGRSVYMPDAMRTDKVTGMTGPAFKRQIRPFTAINSSRDYRVMYRAVFDFHERHNPPRIDDLDAYRQELKTDAAQLVQHFNGDLFVSGMLRAVISELTREAVTAEAEAFYNRHCSSGSSEPEEYWTETNDDFMRTCNRLTEIYGENQFMDDLFASYHKQLEDLKT